MGIRGQLLMLVAGIVAVGLAFGTIAEVRREQRELVEDFRSQSEKVLQSIGVTVAVHVAQNDMGGLDTLVAHLSEGMKTRDLLSLGVIDDEGRVLAHSDPELFNTLVTSEFERTAIRNDGPTWVREGDVFRI